MMFQVKVQQQCPQKVSFYIFLDSIVNTYCWIHGTYTIEPLDDTQVRCQSLICSYYTDDFRLIEGPTPPRRKHTLTSTVIMELFTQELDRSMLTFIEKSTITSISGLLSYYLIRLFSTFSLLFDILYLGAFLLLALLYVEELFGGWKNEVHSRRNERKDT